MATDWIARYSANLDVRDRREAVHARYIDACESSASTEVIPGKILYESISFIVAHRLTEQTPPVSAPIPSPATTGKTKSPPPPTESYDVTSLRALLAAANSTRTSLSTSLQTATSRISALETSLAAGTSRIATLESALANQTGRTRDRDHELREKSKLLEAVQDEVVGLTLGLNLAEEKVARLEGEVGTLRKENEELVRRWLERVGVEAEAAGIRGGGRAEA
ncbi:hypothetical protein ANO11243_070090 [Dothideomycetidae sp. 11243]|nr:hypothetical protein ANO11243_070090 [fungal sp. No.11243]